MRLLETFFSWFSGASRTASPVTKKAPKRNRPSRKAKAAMTAEVVAITAGRNKKTQRPALRRASHRPVLKIQESGPALFRRLGERVGILPGHAPGTVLLSVPVAEHRQSHRGVLTMELALVLTDGRSVPLTDLCLERDGHCYPMRLQARPAEGIAFDATSASGVTHLRVACGTKCRDIPNLYHGG